MLIFSQIQCFGFSGNAFAGVITEFSALTVYGYDAALGTQSLRIIQLGAVQAVAAATVNTFSEQHAITSLILMSRLYTNCRRNATTFFRILQSNHASDQNRRRNGENAAAIVSK